MGGFFGGGPKEPAPPPPPPERSDAEVRQAALDQRLRRARSIGRRETIQNIGGGAGLDTDNTAAVKTLLGA